MPLPGPEGPSILRPASSSPMRSANRMSAPPPRSVSAAPYKSTRRSTICPASWLDCPNHCRRFTPCYEPPVQQDCRRERRAASSNVDVTASRLGPRRCSPVRISPRPRHQRCCNTAVHRLDEQEFTRVDCSEEACRRPSRSSQITLPVRHEQEWLPRNGAPLRAYDSQTSHVEPGDGHDYLSGCPLHISTSTPFSTSPSRLRSGWAIG